MDFLPQIVDKLCFPFIHLSGLPYNLYKYLAPTKFYSKKLH